MRADLIIGALSTLIGVLITYYNAYNKNKRDDFHDIVNELKSQRDEYKKMANDLQTENDKLRKEIDDEKH